MYVLYIYVRLVFICANKVLVVPNDVFQHQDSTPNSTFILITIAGFCLRFGFRLLIVYKWLNEGHGYQG